VLPPSVQKSSWRYYPIDIDQFCEDSFVLVLVLEWKRSSGVRRLHVGLVGIVTGSGLVPLYTKPSSTRTSTIIGSGHQRLRAGTLPHHRLFRLYLLRLSVTLDFASTSTLIARKRPRCLFVFLRACLCLSLLSIRLPHGPDLAFRYGCCHCSRSFPFI
jgi:hypothetical protein